MQTPLQITFRGMAPSPSIDATIRDRMQRLERWHDRITRCHVVVDVPHRHQHKGRAYSVRLDITTPTGEVVALTREAPDGKSEDLYLAIGQAFDAARRQLDHELGRRRRA